MLKFLRCSVPLALLGQLFTVPLAQPHQLFSSTYSATSGAQFPLLIYFSCSILLVQLHQLYCSTCSDTSTVQFYLLSYISCALPLAWLNPPFISTWNATSLFSPPDRSTIYVSTAAFPVVFVWFRYIVFWRQRILHDHFLWFFYY